ncbi:MAG: protoheme IX farnesyltransferase [Polyangiaceae bacterium]|nr:protoheme IX farnesyltransferase [Polyangiaceae bacterium]
MQPAPALAQPRSLLQVLRDIVALTKPRITFMVVVTAAGGYWLASRFFGLDPLGDPSRLIALLLGSALVVSGANALNMFLERDTDGLMARTKSRPLPTGRLTPEVALIVGLGLSAVSVPLLTMGTEPATGLLAAIALVSYVVVYTPLKRRSPIALLVGSIPGAIPPLMGWAAVRGTMDLPGVVLFAIMFFWQVPHFLAIATFRREEYARAGMKVGPIVYGDRVSRHHIVRYTAALVITSMMLVPFGIGGTAYLVVALFLGAVFFAVGVWGLRSSAGNRWARGLFFTSMVYLTGLFAALTVVA